MTRHSLPVLAAILCLSSILAYGGPTKAQSNTVTLWTKFNVKTPHNSQDNWLAAFEAKYPADNKGATITDVFQPYDKINVNLHLAIQSGQDVPDISYMSIEYTKPFWLSHDLMDLSDFVKSATWYKDIDPVDLSNCTAPDGKIYCVPTSVTSILTYYWKESYPDKFPGTTDELLNSAINGGFSLTFKGSEAQGIETTWFPLIASAGSDVTDDKGNATWANPTVQKVIEWGRAMLKTKHAPPADIQPKFDDENSFKDGQAGAIMAGSWSYVYLYPIKSPGGSVYNNKGNSLFDAFLAGKIGYAPPVAWPGGKPVDVLTGSAWAIPRNAANVKGAEDFINYFMTTDQDLKFALAYGAAPTLLSAQVDKTFQTPYWQNIVSYNQSYGHIMPDFADFDGSGIKTLADTITKLLNNTDLDIPTELKASQDAYNNHVIAAATSAATATK